VEPLLSAKKYIPEILTPTSEDKMINNGASVPTLILVELAPDPDRVIALAIVSCDDHVQVPEGTDTVSPAEAVLYADCTSPGEQLAALIVAACTQFENAKTIKNKIKNTKLKNIFLIKIILKFETIPNSTTEFLDR
jgi:hypothetical protein